MDVSSEGGIVKIEQVAPPSYPYTYDFDSDASVTIEAVPDAGYAFDGWSGDLSGTANPTTILMNCNKKITANFSQITTTKVSWPLAGGVIAGFVLAGLLVFVLIIRR